MASPQVSTLNLSDNGDGMVPLNTNPTTSFVNNEAEKNIHPNKETMDSTPINDIMMEPPMMTDEPRMQGMMPQMTAPNPQGGFAPMPQTKEKEPESKNPFNLTDDQLISLVAGLAAAIAVSKPVQDKLVTSIPKFLNEQGNRSMVGLASTGLVAALAFYIAKNYIVKP
jgi:hypothetical protein